jgi:hypothetical protein
MSKTIVDVILGFTKKNNLPIGLIPSRRQVDYLGGYVNNWTTESFTKYVRSIAPNTVIIRDHGGPLQGSAPDNGMDSMIADCSFFDGIHIDVWKKYQDIDEAIEVTTMNILTCLSVNTKLFFEVGTEEAIRKYEAEDLDYILTKLKSNLPDYFHKIKYAVVQAGTSLKNTTNTGSYNKPRLQDMVNVCRRHGVLSKEHNGDYISQEDKLSKFSTGLDCINIAPEFGVIETETILRNLTPSEVERMFTICHDSKKWVKWVNKDFNPFDNKIETIKICGHYIRTDPFINDIVDSKGIKQEVEKDVLIKLEEIYNNVI